VTKGVFEEGVPIPPPNTFRGPLSTMLWALADKEVGSSVFFEDANNELVRVVVSKIKKRKGVDMTTRKMDGGIRVWRVA
jgi:hypothetical protein